jgi:sugar lactone lactonase YvrE
MRKSVLLLAFAVSTCVQAHAQQVVNFPAADLVLGQTNFTSGNAAITPTASNLGEMSAVIIDPTSGKVFVADTGNSRVLRYPDKDTLANGAAAEYVFGQANFTSALSSDPPSATSTNSPIGLALDGSGNLWVSDTDNNRVLMFSSAVTRVDVLPAATKVLGQAGFVTRNAASPPSASSMNAPMGLHIDDSGDLWVADSTNRRVLRFDNAVGLANGAAAGGVLGQGSFVTNTSGSGAGAFADPVAVTVDGTGTLWVADRSNNRVSGFPLAGSAANGAAATRVLGQSSFATVTAGLSASRFDGPSGVFADANVLWVLDQSNHRALRFAGLGGIANGGAASTVVGQPDFTSKDTTVNARRLESPFVGLFLDLSGSLWVSDLSHNRVLRFNPGIEERPTVTVRGRTRFSTGRGSVLLRGRASAGVSIDRVIVQNQTVPFFARGTEKWKVRIRLVDGRNLLRVFAIDENEVRSRPLRVVVTRL